MSELKVGDRVRLSTGVEGEIVDHYGTAGFEFKAEDGNCFFSEALESLNISWEVVEQPVPVEPPVGSVIRFKNRTGATRIAMRNPYWSSRWLVDHIEDSFDWAELIERYGFPEFELLRPEKEVAAEVLRDVHDLGVKSSYTAALQVAREHGVSL